MNNLADQIHHMNRKGGYILAFSTRIAAEHPELSWEDFRNLLLRNGTFCGYAEIVVRRAFERGRPA